jgi:hypothetical protein
MTTGFGFCPTCGTPRTAAEQKFCPACGSAFAAAPAALPVAPVASSVPPGAPPAWSTPPAGEPTAQAPWTAPPASPQAAPSYPPPYPGAPTAAPSASAATSAGNKSRRPLLLLGGLVLVVAIVGVFAYMNMSSSTPGSVSLTPSTISCSSTASVVATIHLPSSVHAGDVISDQTDGKMATTFTVGAASGLVQQSDGSWLLTGPSLTSTVCGSGISMGTHTESLLSSSGQVLARTTYTLTP